MKKLLLLSAALLCGCAMFGRMGYGASGFKRQPQRWPEAQPRPPLK